MLTCLSIAASILVVLILRNRKHTYVYLVVTCLQHVVTQKHKNNKKKQQFLGVFGKSYVTLQRRHHPSFPLFIHRTRKACNPSVFLILAPLTEKRKALLHAQQNASPQKLLICPWLIIPEGVPARLQAPERIITRQRGFRACVKMESPTGSRTKKEKKYIPRTSVYCIVNLR